MKTIKYNNKFLKYVDYEIVNYTETCMDTVYIIFHFCPDWDTKHNDEYKEYIKDITVVVRDLIEHININFYNEQIVNESSALGDFHDYEYDENGEIIKLNLRFPIIDVTNEKDSVDSCNNICIQEIKGYTPHYLISYTSIG